MAPNNNLPRPQGPITEAEKAQYPHLDFLPLPDRPHLWQTITPLKHGVEGRAAVVDANGNIVADPRPPPKTKLFFEVNTDEGDEEDDGENDGSGKKGKRIHNDRMMAAFHLAKQHYLSIGKNELVVEAAAKVWNVVCEAEVVALGRQPFKGGTLESTYNNRDNPVRNVHWLRVLRHVDEGRYEGLRREIEEAAQQF